MVFDDCDDMKWLKKHGSIRAMESHVHSYEMIWIPKHSALLGSLLTLGRDEEDASRKMVNLVKDALYKWIIDNQ